MPIATSAVEICNQALGEIGQTTIQNLTSPETEQGAYMASIYDDVRQKLLREYPWNFAKKRVVLAPLSTPTPAFDFGTYFPLPSDCLRILSLDGDNEALQTKDYDIEGRKILVPSGATQVKLRYIYDAVTVAEFDPLFKNLLKLELALAAAYKFTLQNSVVERLQSRILADLLKAISVDGQERPPIKIQSNPYSDVRRGGYPTSPYYYRPY